MLYTTLTYSTILGFFFMIVSSRRLDWQKKSLQVAQNIRKPLIYVSSNIRSTVAKLLVCADSPKDEQRRIFTKNEVEQQYSLDTWQRQGYEDFVSILLAKEYGMKTFPCVYATKGYRANEHHYCFLHSENPSDPINVRHIAKALLDYLPLSKTAGYNTSLVIMAPPPNTNKAPKTVDDYLQSYWRCLKALRAFDPEPWPQDIPEHTASERWCYCFQGISSFMAVMTPAHEKRRSRYAPNFCIVYQPKWIFDVLFSTPAKREAACSKVRGLIGEFDDVEVSPDVTHYGQDGSSEARQYFLLDENHPSVCPFGNLSG